MKAGIVVVAEITGEVVERIHEVQRKYDPRMAGDEPDVLAPAGTM